MFKKRTRPTSVREKRSEDVSVSQDEDKAALASGSGSGGEGERTPGLVGEDGDEDGDGTARTIEELVLLRKLRKMQAQQGIDLLKLNRGEDKKGKGKKKKADGDGDDEDKDRDAGQIYGLNSGSGSKRAEDKEEEENDSAGAKRLVRANNFTQQTNALDVDKHMMAYIESELAKRRGEASDDPSADGKPKGEEAYDPQAELYKVSERYKIESKKTQKEEEGNVTNSLGMLTSIPEVDLGMDNRLRNIEMTERAKREMMEERRQAALRNPEEEDYAAARFFRPHQRVASDIYAAQDAKRAEAGLPPRAQNATDEQVYERFKKRMKR